METYLTMLYVTVEQEQALRQFFIGHGWPYYKPDLSVTTDKLGLLIPKFTCSGNLTIVNKSGTSDKESTAPYTFGSKPSPKSSKEECMESNHESTVSESANVKEPVTENLGETGKIIRRLEDDSDFDYDDLCGPDEEDDENEFTVLYKTDRTENCNKNFEEIIAHGQGSTPQRRKRNQTSSGLKSPSSTFHETRSVTKAESSRKRRKVASETTFASEGVGGDVIGGTQTLSIKAAAVQEVPIVKSWGRPLSKTNRTKQITTKQKTASRNVIPVASIDTRSIPQKQKTRPKEEVLSDNEDSPFKNQGENNALFTETTLMQYSQSALVGTNYKSFMDATNQHFTMANEPKPVVEVGGMNIKPLTYLDEDLKPEILQHELEFDPAGDVNEVDKYDKKFVDELKLAQTDVNSDINIEKHEQIAGTVTHLIKDEMNIHSTNGSCVLEESSTFICSTCGKGFHHNPSLRRHMKQHENATYECEVCGKIFSTTDYLGNHVKRVHCSNDRKFICSVCGNEYKSLHSLIAHSKYKHEKFGFSCSICKKTFQHTSGLNRHLKSHSEETEQCNICGKQVKHLDVHAKACELRCPNEKGEIRERQYSCEYCKQTFLVKRYLTVHVKRKHLMPNQYVCNCGKRFSYRSSLMRHKFNFCTEK